MVESREFYLVSFAPRTPTPSRAWHILENFTEENSIATRQMTPVPLLSV